MKILLDSAALPAAQRLRVWRGLICDTYVGLDSHYADDFHAVVRGHTIGDSALTRATASTPHHVDRSRTLIKRDRQEVLFFGFVLAGRVMMQQSGREAVVESGSIVFDDATRPFRTDFGADVDLGWLAIPRKALEDRVGTFEDLTAVSFGPSSPVQQIAFDFLSGLGAVLDSGVRATEAAALVDQAIDLLAMMIRGSATPTTASAMAALRATRLHRLKSYVDEYLHRPDLSRASVAAAVGLTQGQVEALFALEATTFDRFVLTRRLEGSRAFLSSEMPWCRSIDEVATIWGFAGTKQFCRAFERRFGTLPFDRPIEP